MIDVAGGEKVRRKGGPEFTRSNLLVIIKTGLAECVCACMKIMHSDTLRMREDAPFVFTNLKLGEGIPEICRFLVEDGLLSDDL